MEPIPWYRSPVYVNTVVQMISMTVVGLGLQTVVPLTAINGYVQSLFVALGLGAGFIAERKRRKSPVQPIMASKKAVEKAIAADPSLSGRHPTLQVPPVPPLAIVMAMMAMGGLFTGCATQRVAETVEQRAGALIGDFNIFQSAALHVGGDPAVPDAVRRKVVDTAVALKPAVDQLDELLRSYIAIKAELDAAVETEAKSRAQARLEIAATNLSAWIIDLKPKIASLRTALEGAFP